MTDRLPPQLVELLRIQRLAGFEFDEAWLEALEKMEPMVREDWMEALLETESGWERAYERAPSRLAELEPLEADKKPDTHLPQSSVVLGPEMGARGVSRRFPAVGKTHR